MFVLYSRGLGRAETHPLPPWSDHARGVPLRGSGADDAGADCALWETADTDPDTGDALSGKYSGHRKKVPGRPIIYGTTERFLEYFGLEQVTDLPGLEELMAAGLLESRLPPNLDIREPQEIDHSQIEPFGEDENIDDLINSGHEAE